KLFLSATPHNGYLDSFTVLLELLDNQRFARGIRPADEQLRTAVVRRLKSEIVDPWGKPKFAKRDIVLWKSTTRVKSAASTRCCASILTPARRRLAMPSSAARPNSF